MAVNSRLSGMKDLPIGERRARIARSTSVEPERLEVLDPEQGLTLEQADHMIENAIGVFGVPLGVATNFTVNGRDYLIPMATEEPSVIAAASNAARIARVNGGFTTSTTEPLMRAQIQILDVADPHTARLRLFEARDELMALADKQDPQLSRIGGGVRDVDVHLVDAPAATYVVLHLIVDVRDAMGANAVNTMAEAVAGRAARSPRAVRCCGSSATRPTCACAGRVPCSTPTRSAGPRWSTTSCTPPRWPRRTPTAPPPTTRGS